MTDRRQTENSERERDRQICRPQMLRNFPPLSGFDNLRSVYMRFCSCVRWLDDADTVAHTGWTIGGRPAGLDQDAFVLRVNIVQHGSVSARSIEEASRNRLRQTRRSSCWRRRLLLPCLSPPCRIAAARECDRSLIYAQYAVPYSGYLTNRTSWVALRPGSRVGWRF